MIAFSSGFLIPGRYHDSPRIFITHGRRDTVLPIDRCSRRIVPILKRHSYDVAYHEFDDGHTIIIPLIKDAWQWFIKDK